MSRLGLIGVCVLSAIAVGCDSNDKREPDDETDDSSVTTTYAQLASVAKVIYDAVEAGEDVSPYIGEVFEAFGVPVLANDDIEGAKARIAAGLPVVTARLVGRMAQGYADGAFVDAESFFEGLAEHGVSLKPPADQDSRGIGYVLGSTIYSNAYASWSFSGTPLTAKTVLPTFVWALGQERARRANVPNAVLKTWPDGRFDPLQMTLMTFTIFLKQSAAAHTTAMAASDTAVQSRSALVAGPAANFIKDQIKGEVTSFAQDFVELPLDEQDAAKVSVCGSLILYGHKVTMTNTPSLIWRAPLAPSSTQVKLTLTFEDDYHDNWAGEVIGHATSAVTGCEFPRQGPIEGKAVKWSVSDGLDGQGSYDVAQPITDASGNAVATWRTISDNQPEACRTLDRQRDANGATEAVISGLLPGWSTLESIVTFLNPNTGGQGNASLTVNYYPRLTIDDTCHRE